MNISGHPGGHPWRPARSSSPEPSFTRFILVQRLLKIYFTELGTQLEKNRGLTHSTLGFVCVEA